MDEIQPGSLVLYKNRPARLLRTAERLEIELESGEIARVRSKDILLLHPGPLESMKDLSLQAGDIHTAWEILCGGRTSLEELAVLAYGSFTPATAWSAWQSVAEQLFFSGSPTDIRVHTASEVEQNKKLVLKLRPSSRPGDRAATAPGVAISIRRIVRGFSRARTWPWGGLRTAASWASQVALKRLRMLMLSCSNLEYGTTA
jgi:hypothetical protein